MKKFFLALITLVLIAALGLGIYWTSRNLKAIKESVNGANVYTKSDIEAAYEDGYTTAYREKEAVDALLNEQRERIDELNRTVRDYNTLQNRIEALKGNYASVEERIAALETFRDNTDGYINNLTRTIAALEAELEESGSTELLSRINELTEENNALRAHVGELNEIITALTAEKEALQRNIESFEAECETNRQTILTLARTIDELEAELERYRAGENN